MSIQVDETKSDAHIKMRIKLEFFEAWGRAVDDMKSPLGQLSNVT